MPPVSLIIELFLQVILPALAVSAAIVLLVKQPRLAPAAPALALAAGLTVSNFLRAAVPWIPEQAAWHWLLLTALAALLLGLLIPHMPAASGWTLRAVGAGLAAWLLIPAQVRAETAWLPPAFFAAVLAEWVVLERAAERNPGGGVAAALALAFAGGAAVMIHAHSGRLADVGFMSAAALAGIALAAWWRQADTTTAMPGAAVLLPGLLLAGYTETFSDVPTKSFVLVALAPLVLTLTLFPPLSRLTGRRLWAVQVVLMLMPIALAVGLAMQAEPLELE